jgi:hypothetical protein
MTRPLHHLSSITVAGPATAVHTRLAADGLDAVTSATAAALDLLGPPARSTGLPPRALPTVGARAGEGADGSGIGSLELRWSGAEDATGWPALTASLVVTPTGPTSSRLSLFSRRSPGAELHTTRVGRLHRQRLLDLAVRSFLREFVAALDLRSPAPSPPATDAGHGDARSPRFVHATAWVPGPAEAVHAAISHDAPALARRATTVALHHLAPILAAGRFRLVADPLVVTAVPGPGELGSVTVGWRTYEEATGWPAMDLTVLTTSGDGGTRLALLSRRAPGYDLSVNRVDKYHRDRLGRAAPERFLNTLADELAAATRVAGQPVLV